MWQEFQRQQLAGTSSVSELLSETWKDLWTCEPACWRCETMGALHRRIHTGNRPYRCQEEDCTKRYANRARLSPRFLSRFLIVVPAIQKKHFWIAMYNGVMHKHLAAAIIAAPFIVASIMTTNANTTTTAAAAILTFQCHRRVPRHQRSGCPRFRLQTTADHLLTAPNRLWPLGRCHLHLPC